MIAIALTFTLTVFMLAFRALCPALSSALGSKYTGLSKDSVSGSFMLLENPVTALRQHRIPLREGWECVNLLVKSCGILR